MACLFGHRWNGCKCNICGEKRDEGHDWQYGECRRCGMRQEDSNNYAVQLMDHGSYVLAILCFRNIEARPLHRRDCSKELWFCIEERFEKNREAIAGNDLARYSTQCIGVTLDALEKDYGPVFGRHPMYDQLMERANTRRPKVG